MNETSFARQYMRNFERQTGAVDFKIPDPRMAAGQGHLTGARFVDNVVCCDGIFMALEWKYFVNPRRGFRIDKVRESQLVVLEHVIEAGGVGRLMFGLYRGPRDKIVYIISPDSWRKAVANVDLKSIRIDEHFKHYATTMHNAGSYRHWNIEPLKELINAAKNRN